MISHSHDFPVTSLCVHSSISDTLVYVFSTCFDVVKLPLILAGVSSFNNHSNLANVYQDER